MSFSSIIGQLEAKQRLGSALRGEPGHAYLFAGARGSGRMLLARQFAAALICQQPDENGACGICGSCRYLAAGAHPDYREVLIAPDEKVIPVDRVRRLITSDLAPAPQISRCRVWLVNADDLNEQGQNALLKSLEEPPEHAVFLLLAASPDVLLPTVRSRLQLIRVKRNTPEEIVQILTAQGLVPSSDLDFYARFANGLPGVALDLAQSDWFADLRRETIEWYTRLPDASRTELLTDGLAFFDANKDGAADILDLLITLVRDQIMLAGQTGGELINQDQTDLLQKLEATAARRRGADRERRLTGLFRAHEALLGARRDLAANASFESLVCRLWLDLRKEFAHA